MDLSKLSSGKNPQNGEVNVFIEIPAGVSVKYELDKESGMIMVDRFLYTDMAYPFNYGFVPHTLSGDGDPLDVLVLTSKPVVPGVVIGAKVIGVLETEDESGPDSKVIAVPMEKTNPEFGKYNDVSELPKAVTENIKHFFEHYKEKEPGKWVKVSGWKGKSEAIKAVNESLNKVK